ncbi:hypothetical protein AMS68_001668 [Peltaster fructicola]|uniref:Uncharacterized protein n=1 Tax=Peltaster fructicola TaxID=286661 RepID=A0A6H0XNC2_9PEZI|nr:hypothetical protein AMS68_001668 [Peltaster fructicola]
MMASKYDDDMKRRTRQIYHHGTNPVCKEIYLVLQPCSTVATTNIGYPLQDGKLLARQCSSNSAVIRFVAYMIELLVASKEGSLDSECRDVLYQGVKRNLQSAQSSALATAISSRLEVLHLTSAVQVPPSTCCPKFFL